MAALGTLLNIKINYYAAVNLQSFVNVVNDLGGVDVNVAHGFCDPTYDHVRLSRTASRSRPATIT